MTTKHTPTHWDAAAHIVKCVNEHDQLQEKLKVAVEALEIIKSTEKGRVALISLQALATIKDSNLTKKKEV